MKKISLALQGGGGWGAYTWGVLTKVLVHPAFLVTQVSGTSAGAINGAILCCGLVLGGAPEALRRLNGFWNALVDFPASGFGKLFSALPFEAPKGIAGLGAWIWGREFLSPYGANPLNINLLRGLIETYVDIKALRSPEAPELFITLTNVRTGLPHVLSNEEICVDALMASACLPDLFQTVELEGEAYWDGGFCGNPTLWPLIRSGASADIVLVQLSPSRVDEIPTTEMAIRQRFREIVFYSSLVAEMQAICGIRDTDRLAGRDDSIFLTTRFHRIGPPPLSALAAGTLDRTWQQLETLYREGCSAAESFLEGPGKDVGHKETLPIAEVFSGSKLKP